MRILVRLFLFWLVMAPISFYFGFPLLLDKLQQKARHENTTECLKQTAAQPGLFPSELPEIAEKFCDCINLGIVMERDDVFDILRKRPPEKLTLKMDAQAQICNERLVKPKPEDAQIMYF